MDDASIRPRMRQAVIGELMKTEVDYVRDLKIMSILYMAPMQQKIGAKVIIRSF